MTKTNRWLLVPAAIWVVFMALLVTSLARLLLQWWDNHEPSEHATQFVGPLRDVEIVAESDYESRDEVRSELNRLVALGYEFEGAAGGVGGRWFVMQKKATKNAKGE